MPSWDEWTRVCYHEAGHAVATLAVGQPSVPLVLRCITTSAGSLEAQGTFQSPVTVQQGVSIVDLLHKLAAGRVAEEIHFGNHGQGVTGDMAKVTIIANMVAAQGVLMPQQEQQNGFPATRALLQNNWPAVIRIAEICLRRFRPLNLQETAFFNRQILSANAVSRIIHNSPLTVQEYANAQLAAYYYSQERGNGTMPAFDPNAVQSDFEKAAGDILGATP